jgi:hypothetical protein
MYGNFIKETTPTAGTGTITLSAVSSYERFGTVFANNDPCFYSIQDGANREFGIGTWQTGNLLARTTVLETWVAGVRTIVSPTAISLSGSGVFVTNDVGFQYLPNPRYSATISAGSTTNIWRKDGDVILVDCSGFGNISSFGTADHAGQMRWISVAPGGSRSIVNGSGITCVSGATLTTGDLLLVVANTTTTSTVLLWVRADGKSNIPTQCLALTGGTLTGGLSLGSGNNIINVGAIQYYQEYDNGNSGTGLSIDMSSNAFSKVTLNAASPTLNLFGVGAGTYYLRIVQDGTGGRVPTFTSGGQYSSSRWVGSATQPAFNTAPNGETMITFISNGSMFVCQRADKIGTA